MKEKHQGVLLIALLITLFLNACSTSIQIPEVEGSRLGPAEEKDLFDRINAQAEQIRSGKMLLKTSITHGSDLFSFRQAVVFHKPDSIRIESFPDNSFFSLNLFVSGKEGSLFLDNQEKEVYLSADPRLLLEEQLHFPVDETLLFRIISGYFESLDFSNRYHALRLSGNEIALRVSDGSELWLIDEESLRIKRFWLSVDGDKDVTISGLLTYQPLSLLPEEIEASLPKKNLSLKFKRVSSTINPEISDSLFQARIPDGYEIKN